MDLNDLDIAVTSEQGAVLEITHPTTKAPIVNAEGVPWTITLAGDDSERYRKQARVNENRRRAMRGRRGGDTPTSEETEADAIRLLTACTISWTGLTRDGAPLPLNEANAKYLYGTFRFIYEQADQFIFDRSNFLPPSSKTSEPLPDINSASTSQTKTDTPNEST